MMIFVNNSRKTKLSEKQKEEIENYLEIIMEEFNLNKIYAIDKLMTTAVEQKNDVLISYLFYYKKALIEQNIIYPR